MGTCKVCGVHCQQSSAYDYDSRESHYKTRKLTDEEWRRESESDEKWKRQAESWPFISGEENHVARHGIPY